MANLSDCVALLHTILADLDAAASASGEPYASGIQAAACHLQLGCDLLDDLQVNERLPKLAAGAR